MAGNGTIEKSMIERVAEAIWMANKPPIAPDFDALDVRDQDVVELIAIQCIRAMREPTAAMLNSNDPVAVIEMAKLWEAMIDRALEAE